VTPTTSSPSRSPAAVLALAALAALALAPAAAAADPLSLEQAVRAAWARNPALGASAAQVAAARADAARARDGRLPTLSLAARGVRTDEPMMAFGLLLDEGRVAASSFDPARLNSPPAVGGWGGGVTVSLPIYAGGRLVAGQRAAEAMADAESAGHARRAQELAEAVVEAYFGAQAAEEGLRHADELCAQAAETERFVRARAAEGLALDADVARSTAFRAQAEAVRAAARQRRESARSGLGLLTGEDAPAAELVTSIEVPSAPPPAAASTPRPDLEAARLRRDAAEEGVRLARGSLLPMVAAQASAEALRSPSLADGRAWTTLGLVARWDLALGDLRAVEAARARARAAEQALAWAERQAARDGDESRRAVEAADARMLAAREAVAASESARTLRLARHRQGLLPLTDVLDAETGLAGARALLVASRLEARVARARLALALNQPVEGLTP
jgi:outer membrane protein TolC